MMWTISFKAMWQLNPKVHKCNCCGEAVLQPTKDTYEPEAQSDPVVIKEDLTNTLYQLTRVAISPSTVGPAPAPVQTSHDGGVKYSPGFDRYDADFQNAAWTLEWKKRKNRKTKS
jgi:hypothetical protein